jgi:hypothetical protein
VAVGPTTDGAIAANPEAIRAYRGFLRHHGEAIDQEAPFDACVADQHHAGGLIGNGTAGILFGPDGEPLDGEEIGVRLRPIEGISGKLREWASTGAAKELDEPPTGRGLPARDVLRHVLAARKATSRRHQEKHSDPGAPLRPLSAERSDLPRR